jgi:hypothetical protein
VLPSGGRLSLQESKEALGGVRLSDTAARSSMGSHGWPAANTPKLPATSATERMGFAPRYYNATHIWASTVTAGTLLPKRRIPAALVASHQPRRAAGRRGQSSEFHKKYCAPT